MGSHYPQNAGRLRLVEQRPILPGPVLPASCPNAAAPLTALTGRAAAFPAAGPAAAAVAAAGNFAEALHGAIEASGLSLDRIRTALAGQGVRISVTTLSYWRRGRSQPERASSVRAVALLEELLGLPTAALSGLLGPPRPRGRWAAGAMPGSLPVAEVWPEEQRVAQVFEELDAPPISELERLSIHDAYYVDAGRLGHLLRMRQVVRATVPGVSRCLVVHKADEGATGCPEISSVRHARLGRVRRCPEIGLLVAELLLDRPLALGDSTVFEYEVEIPRGEPTTGYGRRFAVPVREYVLQVHFDPAAVPAHCERYERNPGAESDRLRQRLWIGASASAHVLATEQPPGQTGIRWEWE
ncbi:XRE family transcriptional regulator [Kitasatospora sp. NPDC052896]|uniref:XRE family transcriptional regulator n=1 Tax=Kitasatospora sp. NPDC052896 TaxID=3364061 RepID=UPI0037C9C209